MGRAPCCDKASVKKGPWSPEEDAKLKDFIDKHGTGGNWIALPHKAGLKRCGKSCRLRWLNYLRPNIKHGEFSEDEDRIICSLYASIGSRWSIIAGQLPGRTDNDVKNYWNTKLRKKLLAMLPSFQKKPSFYPSMPLQSPPPISDNYKSDNFFNPSSSFYNFNPSFMNVGNNMINSLLTTTTASTAAGGLVQDNVNVTDLISPPSNALNNGVMNNYCLGFQENMNKECYYKERMLMFGGSSELSATGSSSDGGGSFMSQINYNNDHHHHQRIKQEDQFALEGFRDQGHYRFIMTDHDNSNCIIDQKPREYFKNDVVSNLEEAVKQSFDTNINRSNNVNVDSYLMNDDDENKTTHFITDGCYTMIDGAN